jgi:murein DD-endopeptidase MepM/ murein hydrolase activator NlpD
MKPLFQMPFMCHQKWRASTYDGHAPDQDSIDLIHFSGSSNISAGQPVFASAAGTVVEAHDTHTESPPYGSVVTIDHGGGWKTQYVHLDDSLSVKKNQTVVRGQKVGKVGTISGLEPHLHYVQIKDGNAVRIEFNGVAIAVHAGATKPDGTYPKQFLTSANCPTGITKKTIGNGGSATCNEGAGVRATAKCLITHIGKNVSKKGPWVGAKGISKAQCSGGQEFISNGFEIS